MRWAIVVIKSFATGAFATLLALVALVVALFLYPDRYTKDVLHHLGPNEQMGWDPVSLFHQLFGRHWKFVILSIPVLIFFIGFSAGFWFFSRALRPSD